MSTNSVMARLRVAGVLAAALTISFLVSGLAFGQAVSQISGTVRDESGAVVPGVQVTATQTETGVKRAVVADDAGYYVLTNLPLGPYRLEASKSGFRTYVQVRHSIAGQQPAGGPHYARCGASIRVGSGGSECCPN